MRVSTRAALSPALLAALCALTSALAQPCEPVVPPTVFPRPIASAKPGVGGRGVGIKKVRRSGAFLEAARVPARFKH
jgi:hypothetical protein